MEEDFDDEARAVAFSLMQMDVLDDEQENAEVPQQQQQQQQHAAQQLQLLQHQQPTTTTHTKLKDAPDTIGTFNKLIYEKGVGVVYLDPELAAFDELHETKKTKEVRLVRKLVASLGKGCAAENQQVDPRGNNPCIFNLFNRILTKPQEKLLSATRYGYTTILVPLLIVYANVVFFCLLFALYTTKGKVKH